MPQQSSSNRLSSSGVAWLIALGIFFLLFFAPTLVRVIGVRDGLVGYWLKDPNYSHGFLVPFICLALAVRAWGMPGVSRNPEWGWAAIPFLIGGFLHFAATVMNHPLVDFIALGLMLRGAAVAAGGREWAKRFTFPILFLFFMFPLPYTLTGYAALWLQDKVCWLSVTVLDHFVICAREGTMVSIAGFPQKMSIAEECSGLRQVLTFVAIGALLGELGRLSIPRRILLLFLSLPVAILANTFRVLMVTAIALNYGSDAVIGTKHHISALVSIPTGLLLYWLVYRLLRVGSGEWGVGSKDKEVGSGEWGVGSKNKEVKSEASSLPLLPTPHSPFPTSRGLVGAVAMATLLGVQVALMVHLHAADAQTLPDLQVPLEKIPTFILRDKMGNPGNSTGWIGENVANQDAVRNGLAFQPDDLLNRYYHLNLARSPMEADLSKVEVYAVYSRAGEDRKHHPEVCYREAKGIPEDRNARCTVSLDRDRPEEEAMRFRFKVGESKDLTVYYWHYKLLPEQDASQTRLQRRYLDGQPSPSLTLQVSTEIKDPGMLKEVEEKFLPRLNAALREQILPTRFQVKCDRLPIAVLRE